MRRLISSVVVLIFLLLAAAAIIVALRLTDFSIPNSSPGQAIAAVIAVVGVIFTATVGFVGVLVRQSIDARTHELQKEAERRLILEAGIKALELMDESPSAPSPSAKFSGAILLLADLGLVETAIRLVSSLWPAGKINSPTAMFVIDIGLTSEDPAVQRSAATLLDRHVELIAASRTESAAPWPAALTERWNSEICADARTRILVATARYLVARPRSETPRGVISSMILQFTRALEDPDPGTAAAAAACLVPLHHHFKESKGVIDSSGRTHLLADLRTKHDQFVKRTGLDLVTNDFRVLSSRINDWFVE